MSVISAIRLSSRTSVAFAALGLYWGCFAAYIPAIKANLDVGDGLFGVLLLGTALGLVTSMWLAPRVDRALGARAMQVAAILFGLVTVLPGAAATPLTFVIAVVVVGAASGLLDVVMNARVSALEAAAGRPLMNANHGMFSLAYGIAAVGAGMAREGGVPPSLALGAVGAILVLCAVSLRLNIGPGPEHEDHHHAGFPVVPVLLCGGIVLIAFMADSTVESWSAIHIERTLGGRAAEGAFGPATIGFTMAIGRFSGQALSEKLREVTVILWASGLSAVGVLIAAFAATPVIAYVGFGILGLGVSVVGPIGLAIVGRIVPPRYRTEAISRAAVIAFSGFFVAPVLMGGLSELFGLRWAFASVAVLLLLAVPLSLTVSRRYLSDGRG